MKLQRAGQTATTWNETAHLAPSELAKLWKPGATIELDGTVDKYGSRHTAIGVELTREDFDALYRALLNHAEIKPEEIAAYHRMLIEYEGDCIRKLTKENEQLTKTVTLLEEALRKIFFLLRFDVHRAPSRETLITTAAKIAGYFWREHKRDKPPKLRWIKYDDL